MSYLKGARETLRSSVDLGRELREAERCLGVIGATAVFDRTSAAFAATDLVRALRRATRAAEAIRYTIEHAET